jgi:hypothetical protein
MQSTEAVPAFFLRNKYIEVLKAQGRQFGYIIRGLSNPNDVGAGVITDAVKLTLDGKEQTVRGLRLGNVPTTAFRDLLDASTERTLYNLRGTTLDAISVIVPNLIFEELEIQQARDIGQKPPVVPPPN